MVFEIILNRSRKSPMSTIYLVPSNDEALGNISIPTKHSHIVWLINPFPLSDGLLLIYVFTWIRCIWSFKKILRFYPPSNLVFKNFLACKLLLIKLLKLLPVDLRERVSLLLLLIPKLILLICLLLLLRKVLLF